MAATAVSTVLSKFGELAVSEGRLLVQVGDKMMLMRDRLEWLQAFIRDADRKRRTGIDGLSRVWLRQTRDVAFQVEDALDEFFRKVDLESQGYQGWKKWSKYVAGCWTQITVRHVQSNRLDKINSRLEQISENQKKYNIKHTPLGALTSSTAASAAWQDERDDMVGFDDDVKTIEKMMSRGEHLETMYISIIGESGVGKSRLANILFELPHSAEVPTIRFLAFMEPDSWPEEVVQVLYNVVLKKMEDACAKPAEAGDTNPVAPARVEKDAGPAVPHVVRAKDTTDQAGKLRKYFSGRKFQLLLGSITSIRMLNLLSMCLPDNKNGSSVVLVLNAENEEVALRANEKNQEGINGIHLITRLDKERSVQLFCSKALRKEEVSSDGRKYGERVFGVTGGHRLSIVLVAGLLRFKEKPLQWEAVLQQLMPAAMMQEAGEGEKLSMRANLSTTTAMERIFWACFEDLPNDIKSCFLYLVAAGKNVALRANVIVLMWIGEGFIKPHKGKTMEEVGRGYMKELALRCLVQVHSRDDVGSIVEIGVHGSLHGFLLSEAREAGFMEIHDIHDAFVPPSVRRLSFQIYGGRYSRFTNKFPKLRSFVSLGKRELDGGNIRVDSTGAEKELYNLKFLLASKFLRVLALGGGQRVNELPEEIGNLLELRYIGINSPELKELPASVKRLLNLQTLAIGGSGVERIDAAFWKIKTLRHVLASSLTLPESLEEEQLPELQTLRGVKAPQGQKWDAHNCPLRRMRNLRELELEGIQAEHHCVGLESALQEMHLLVRVTLLGDGLPHCVFTAVNLRFLERIQLVGKVDWPTGPLNAQMLRPNLRRIALEPLEDVPPRIFAELFPGHERNYT